MQAGRLINRIAFYAKEISRDTYNASVDTWPAVTLKTRGNIREIGGRKDLSNEERFFSKSKELTIRYNSVVTETMKLKIDNGPAFYIITYIEILGMKEGMRLSIEKENE